MTQLDITPAMEARLLGAIHNGVYAHVAAEVAGIPRHVFLDLMRRGRRQRQGPSHDLWLKVEEAKAIARAKAEMDVRQNDVRFWLRYGPGKEIDGGPAWSAAPADEKEQQSLLANREFNQLVSWLLRLLEPFPDARRAIVQAVRSRNKQGAPMVSAQGTAHAQATDR
jgi:hypothetical protein